MAATTEASPADAVVPGPALLARMAGLALVAAAIYVVGLASLVADGTAGSLGALRSQYGVGLTLGFVLLGFALQHPISRAIEASAPLPTWWSQIRAWLLRIVPGAWLALAGAYLFPPAVGADRPSVGFSAEAAGSSHLPLREMARAFAFVAPVSGRDLSDTFAVRLLWPAGVAVGAVVVVVTATWLFVGRGEPAGPGRVRRAWLAIGLLLAVGVAFRVLVALIGDDHPALAFRTLAHLDAVAVGMALAQRLLPGRTERGQRSDSPEEVARHRPATGVAGRWVSVVTDLAVAAIAVGGLAVMAALLDLPVGLLFEPAGWKGLVQHLGWVAIAGFVAMSILETGLVRQAAAPDVAVTVQGSDPPGLLGPPGRAAAALGMAYAAVLWVPQVLGRWVARVEPLQSYLMAPVHPFGRIDAGIPSTVAWALVVTGSVAAAAWFLVQRPWANVVHRRLSRFVAGMWAISLASLAGRLWSIATATRTNPGNGDPFYYHAQANMLADRVGFGEPIQWITEGRFVATAIHPPLFTLWLTPTSLLGARGFISHKAMACIAGVLVVVVAGLLGRRLAGDRAGLLAAALVALAPDLWIIDGTLWPEGLYTALVGLALLAAYRWRDRPSLGRAAALGGAIGGAILTRGEAIFLLPFLCLPLVLSRRKVERRWLVHGAVMGAVALAVLAPWTIRNLATFDHPVPVSTNSEEVLYYANCPDVYHGPFIGWWSFNCQQEARAERVADGLPADPPGDESERAAGWGKLGRQYALDHKDRWPAVAFARFTRVWDLQHADNTAGLLRLEGRPYDWSRRGLWFYRLSLIPAVAGLVILVRRRDGSAWPLFAMLAMVSITAVSVYGHIRFRTVGDLVLLVAAGVAIDAVLPGARSWKRPVPPGTDAADPATPEPA